MGPRGMLAAVGVLALGGGAAWFEYGQYTALMQRTASEDVAQLCGVLASDAACPAQLKLPNRDAIDPWDRPYRCLETGAGVLVYTLGRDADKGGGGRDLDIACVSLDQAAVAPDAEPCGCGAGEGVAELLPDS